MPVHPISDESASAEVRRVYDSLRSAGNLSPFQRMLAHKPAMLRAYNQLSGALWSADSKLPEKLKDLAYLRVSILNGCEY